MRNSEYLRTAAVGGGKGGQIDRLWRAAAMKPRVAAGAGWYDESEWTPTPRI